MRVNRRVVSFGWRYAFGAGGLQKADDIPIFLLPLRERAAALSGLAPADLPHVLRRCDRDFPLRVLHAALSQEARSGMAARVAHACTALSLSLARTRAHRMGAQHPGSSGAALLCDLQITDCSMNKLRSSPYVVIAIVLYRSGQVLSPGS
jgi:hypothetical protein